MTSAALTSSTALSSLPPLDDSACDSGAACCVGDGWGVCAPIPPPGYCLGDGADRPYRVGDVLAGLAVAARRRLDERAALVAQVDREAVELHLGGIGDRRVVVGEAERLPDARVELLGASAVVSVRC